MAERMEKMEVTEQVMSPELREQLIDDCMEMSREAAAAGYEDMAQFYREKALALENGTEGSTEQLGESSERQNTEGGNDMQAYYEAKKQKLQAEQNQREKQWRMDKAVHNAPDYAGIGGWRESEYLYEAGKEYDANGDSAEFRRLMKGAENAHIREKYRDILE
ncbi:MAG: hypothetical protein IJ422_03695 [Oscillospiraceae bacterium]|nr:hypothetical protein [Oscillospiraceae bacterium]